MRTNARVMRTALRRHPTIPRRCASFVLVALGGTLACAKPAIDEGLPEGGFTSGPLDSADDDDGDDAQPDDDGGVDDDGEADTTAMDDGAAESETGAPMDSGGSESGFGELSHEVDIRPILMASCISPATACHDADLPAAAFNLETDPYNVLFNFALNGMPYIDGEAMDPGNSYIMHKLNNTQLDVGGGGGPMPQAPGTITDQQIAMIEAWILQGAPP